MDVLGVSSAASPYGSLAPKRPAEAPKPANPIGSAPPQARAEDQAVQAIPKQNQMLVEQVRRFSYAYTFVDPETREVVAKWPVQGVVQPGERVAFFV